MKTIMTSLFLFCAVAFASAQSLSFKANTGDAELDVALSDINKKASLDMTVFKKDLSVNFGVTDGKLNELNVKYGMQPADMYFALEVAKQTGKTIDAVAKTYLTHKSKGWGVIAKELGIKPGSKAFHALKNATKGKNGKMKGNSGGNGNSDKGKGASEKGGSDKGNGASEKGNGGGGNGKGKKK